MSVCLPGAERHPILGALIGGWKISVTMDKLPFAIAAAIDVRHADGDRGGSVSIGRYRAGFEADCSAVGFAIARCGPISRFVSPLTATGQAKGFLRVVPNVEKAMVESGIILLKYWLEVSPEEQTNRLTARIDDKRKIWKLSQMDLDSYTRWDDYTRCRDDMFQATDTAWAPWFIARSDNKRQARLNIISHLLSSIPYKKVPRGDVKLPKRNVARSKPLRNSLRIVPEADLQAIGADRSWHLVLSLATGHVESLYSAKSHQRSVFHTARVIRASV